MTDKSMTDKSMRDKKVAVKKPMNIGHRGARAYAPENTLVAFKKAFELGADGVELDVHLSLDGQLVVHHDDDLIRCSNVQTSDLGHGASGHFYLSDYTLEQIQSLDAGSWFVREYQASLTGNSTEHYLNQLSDEEKQMFIPPAELALYASGQVKIPSLREVLMLMKRYDMVANIELKTLPRLYQGLTDKVVKLVEDMGLVEQTILSSFDHQQLLRARALNKSLYTAALTSDRLAKVNDYLTLLEANAYHPGCHGGVDSLGFNSVTGLVDSTTINLCRDNGFGVNVWTCNDKRHIRQLIDLGVTGVISDMPNRVSEVLQQDY